MKVFIENEAQSDQKNMFDEKTLKFFKTVTVSEKYPYPYGFILNTTSGDGDNLDCFVITDQKLKSGDIVEVEPMGVLEQREDGKEDNNILARLAGEEINIDQQVKKRLTEFINHVFDHRPDKKVEVGRFLGQDVARELIRKCSDQPKTEGAD